MAKRGLQKVSFYFFWLFIIFCQLIPMRADGQSITEQDVRQC
jgi:hypothetical protein